MQQQCEAGAGRAAALRSRAPRGRLRRGPARSGRGSLPLRHELHRRRGGGPRARRTPVPQARVGLHHSGSGRPGRGGAAASALGLDLTPQLGQCYILPYENRKKDGREWITVTEAQFQIGYRGAIALAQRSSQIQCIRAEVVHRDDEFRYSRGLHPMLEHVDSQAEDPGEMTHVYAVAN